MEINEFGLSTLHSWICFFKYSAHLTHRMDVKKWHIRSEDQKRQVVDQKLFVQHEFKQTEFNSGKKVKTGHQMMELGNENFSLNN